jgi:hypothetical protein
MTLIGYSVWRSGPKRCLPDPVQLLGDADLILPTRQTNPTGCFVSESGGKIVGSVAVMDWDSVAMLGPLSVRPDRREPGP